MRRLLLLNILPNNGDRCAATTACKVAGRPEHAATSIIGVDVGIARLATLSNGQVFEAVNSFKQKQTRLAWYSRALSRKVQFSRHWKKPKGKITERHEHHIANIRKDYRHKTTATIRQNQAMIVIEDWQISHMSQSAKGTVDAKGRNVKAKSGVNRSILDQGWLEFRRQLQYKQVWGMGWQAGAQVLALNPRNTRRTCPCCKPVSADNRQTQAQFECVECRYAENADWIGAINILAPGHAVLACRVTAQQSRTTKHEPAEGIGKSSREPLGIPCL